MFDRFEICLGFWHYATAMNGTNEAANIWQRLKKLDYSPGYAEEYSEALDDPEHEIARNTYINLGGEL